MPKIPGWKHLSRNIWEYDGGKIVATISRIPGHWEVKISDKYFGKFDYISHKATRWTEAYVDIVDVQKEIVREIRKMK